MGASPKPIGTESWTTGVRLTWLRLACSPPPAGHDHWTLRLLAGKVVELKLTHPPCPTKGCASV